MSFFWGEMVFWRVLKGEFYLFDALDGLQLFPREKVAWHFFLFLPPELFDALEDLIAFALVDVIA